MARAALGGRPAPSTPMARVIRETLKIRAIPTIRAIHMAPTTRVIRTIRATHIVRTARTEPAAGLAWVSGLLVAVSLPRGSALALASQSLAGSAVGSVVHLGAVPVSAHRVACAAVPVSQAVPRVGRARRPLTPVLAPGALVA